MKDGEAEIGRFVEQLCQEGCERVYAHIDALRAGRQLPGFSPLSPAERRLVLDELLSIMAVYESGCSRR
jgi:hypothetical protein